MLDTKESDLPALRIINPVDGNKKYKFEGEVKSLTVD